MLDDLIETINGKKEFKHNVVSACIFFNRNEIYFNLNNSACTKKNIRIVKDILGQDSIYCGNGYAITYFNPYYNPDYYLKSPDYKQFKSDLKKCGAAFITFKELLDRPMFESKDPIISERHWSCAERKLYGYAMARNLNIKEIYATRIPCMLCLPFINSLYFISSTDRISYLVRHHRAGLFNDTTKFFKIKI